MSSSRRLDDVDLRALAFYLPQYHPVPENDEWWGKGFTEWRNVIKARPRFPGHYQPHLPGELGFYDLRVPEVRAAQAELAQAHGVHGFVYYHYWFHGRRLLQRPLDAVLDSGEPGLPFCLAWANESWTRAWDGYSQAHLIEQRYSEEDDRAHARWLLPVFADPRYERYLGRPVFLVYRAGELPQPRRTTDTIRDESVRAGLPEPYLLRVESFPGECVNPAALGFDAAVEFAPRWWELPRPTALVRGGRRVVGEHGPLKHRIHRYADVARVAQASSPPEDYLRWPGVTPMWDNSARRAANALILTGSTPALFRDWLEHAAERSRRLARRQNSAQAYVFVNAWNEWAEGNHLEPDLRSGRAYLEANAAVFLPARQAPS